MKLSQKTIWIWTNLLGGTAVIASYLFGSLTHANASQALWGSIPTATRPVYTAWMFFAAAGYLATAYSVFRLDTKTTKIFSRYGYELFNAIYLLILVPSALWMPLTLLAIDHPSLFLSWLVRVDLVMVAAGSISLLLAVLKTLPRPTSPHHLFAVFGSLALCIQTVILDAIVWSLYFHA